MVAKLRTQPFGSTRAPANWGRVTALIQWILIAYFGAHLEIYVDDCFVVEPAETIQSAFSRTRLVIEMGGFEVGKFQMPGNSINLLGATISTSQEFAAAPLPEQKRRDLVLQIEEVLASGSLTPGHAAKLRGRLGFPSRSCLGAMAGPNCNR